MWRVLRTLKNPRRVREIGLCRKATPEWKQLLGAYLGFVFQPFSIELSSGRFEFLEKSDVATFWQIFFAQVYPLRPSDRIIVDAGGNIGAFSLFALLAIPECRVFTVEPSPGSFERLGGSVGSTTIMSAGPSQFRRTGAAGDAVPMVTLESILPPGDTDLLKMDIEGAEYDALGSATPAVLQRIRRIVLEMHPTEGTPYRWPSLREHLVSAGFHVTMETDDGGGYGIAHLER